MPGPTHIQTIQGDLHIGSNLQVDTSTFFVDSVSNTVGIGTTNPVCTFDVRGTANVGTLTATSFYGSITGSNTIAASTGTFTGNLEAGTFDVKGISTTSIKKVNGSAATSTYNYILNAPRPGTTSGGAVHFINGSSRTDDGGTNAYTIRNDSGNLILGSASHDTLLSGDVGIGVTNPDNKLEVRGNIQASYNDTNHGMIIENGGTVRRDYGGSGAGFHFTNNAIWPTNHLGNYSAGGMDFGSSSYRWNNIYTEALNASGDLTVSGKIYNYNYTEVDINNPATVSGTWTTSNTSAWGDPKFNHTYDRYRYNDAPGYVEYTIPAGMKSAYLSQLTWSNGGYVDIHGVQDRKSVV